MGLRASPWIAALAQSRRTRRTCTACYRRAFSLHSGDLLRLSGPTWMCEVIASHIVSTALLLVCIFCDVRDARAQDLRVVATTSDLASLARSVAGEFAHIDQIIPPGTDPEAFEPRPSDLAKLRGASLIVRVGLGYDHWLDKMLATHADPRVQRGGAGYVDSSVGIPLLEIKGRSLEAANADGHAHGLANPHYWLDPANAETITGGIGEAMIAVAP